jgi:hypothetical protein
MAGHRGGDELFQSGASGKRALPEGCSPSSVRLALA